MRFLERREFLGEHARQLFHVRQDVRGAGEAEIEMVAVALYRDVERLTVHGDRHRIHVFEFGARNVERKLREEHVRSPYKP